MSVLFRLGDFTFSTYSAVMALAALGGLALAFLEAKRLKEVSYGATLDAVLCLLLGGLIGARLEFVALNLEFFQEQPAAIWQIWQGGLAYHGALLGGALALAAYALWRRLSFWRLADALTPGLALAVSVGWLACFLGGYAYGQMGFGWLHFVWHDLYGVTASRFAVQPLGAGLSFIAFLAVWLARPVFRRPGVLFSLFLLLNGLIHFALGFGRGDETLLWSGWRVDQWLAIGQMAAAVGLMAWRSFKS